MVTTRNNVYVPTPARNARKGQHEQTKGVPTPARNARKGQHEQTKGPQTNNLEASNKSKTIIVFVSLLIELIGFTMILPLFPSIIHYYDKNDGPDGYYTIVRHYIYQFQEHFQIPSEFVNVLVGGFLGSVFSYLQFVASPIFGALSDVYGRKPVILVCLIGIATSYLLWSIADKFIIFVVARIIGGLSKGNVSLSMAAMTDLSTSKTRTFGMALTGIAFSIGFVIGPMVGAYFTPAQTLTNEIWFLNAAYVALGLVLIDILFVLFCLPETLPVHKRSKSFANSFREAVGYLSVMDLFLFTPVQGLTPKEMTELRTLGFVNFLYLFLYSGLEFTLTFLTHHKFHYTSMDQGLMFCAIGVTMAILQGGWVRRIEPAAVQKHLLMGLLLIVPSFICIAFAESKSMLFVGLLLYSASTSIVVPLITVIASKYGNSSHKGKVLGIFRSLGAFARSVGPIMASSAYWLYGPTITYCLGGVLLLIPFYILKGAPVMKK